MEIFSSEFIKFFFCGIILISIISSILGIFLIIKNQSLIIDTFSHILLLGVVFNLIFKINIYFINFLIIIIISFLLEYIKKKYIFNFDVSISILMSLGISLSIILINFFNYKTSIDLQSYLFGSIITLSLKQIKILFILTLILIILYLLFKNQLYLVFFNKDIAFVEGINVKLIDIMFNIITGLIISIMIPILGVLLMSSIVIIPSAISLKIGKNFDSVIIISFVILIISIILGLILSYYLCIPSNSSISFILILIFFINIFLNYK